MKIEQFETPGLSQYAYVVSCGAEALVIDPMRDYDRYLEYAEAEGLTIRYVTETHIHADFASGAAPLAAESSAVLCLSGHDASEQYRYSMDHQNMRDGEELRIGKLRLRALHTPGHTPEHLSFLVFDEARSKAEPTALFSGDFLFVGSAGRPDLLGEHEKQRLVRELYRSLHDRIASVSDGVQLYPGHGAGSLCGSGMSARPTSTLGYERSTQPLFQLVEEEFVHEVLASVPPMPAYYPRMKALNAQGAEDFRKLPEIESISPEKLATELATSTLLDLRKPEAFGGAHIPGSINIGAGQNLSLWAGWMVDPEVPVVLVDDSSESAEARLSLLRVGLDMIAAQLKGGFSAWVDAGRSLARTSQLSTDEVSHRSAEALVLDVRDGKEWVGGHIEGARHIPLGDLLTHLRDLSSDQPIMAVCGSGYRSSIAASLLQREGFSQVSSMDGGMTVWEAQGLAVTNRVVDRMQFGSCADVDVL